MAIMKINRQSWTENQTNEPLNNNQETPTTNRAWFQNPLCLFCVFKCCFKVWSYGGVNIYIYTLSYYMICYNIIAMISESCWSELRTTILHKLVVLLSWCLLVSCCFLVYLLMFSDVIAIVSSNVITLSIIIIISKNITQILLYIKLLLFSSIILVAMSSTIITIIVIGVIILTIDKTNSDNTSGFLIH